MSTDGGNRVEQVTPYGTHETDKTEQVRHV